MNYMTELSRYQKERGLSTADMARLFGVEWQIYKNWLNRNSLPKAHIDRASFILSDQKDDTEINHAVEILNSLSPQGLKAALASIEAIQSLEKKY